MSSKDEHARTVREFEPAWREMSEQVFLGHLAGRGVSLIDAVRILNRLSTKNLKECKAAVEESGLWELGPADDIDWWPDAADRRHRR